MLQEIQPNDMPRRKEFAVNMLQRISEDEAFLERVCFSDEATFHVSGKLNKHNVRIWGSENLHASRELQRDSPKVYVWYGIMCNRIIGPFFFNEASVTANVYLDLLTEYVAPQLIDFNQPSYSSKMVHHHTGNCMFVSSSMKLFPTDGLEGMDRFHGHQVHQISLPWTSFFGVT